MTSRVYNIIDRVNGREKIVRHVQQSIQQSISVSLTDLLQTGRHEVSGIDGDQEVLHGRQHRLLLGRHIFHRVLHRHRAGASGGTIEEC